MFYTYVLRSKKDGKWYTGSTKDLRKRLREHNNGKVFSTKSRGIFELLYFEACHNEQDAMAREKYLKSGMGKRYLRNRMKRFLSLTGFTLVEILVVVLIFSFLSAGMYSVLLTGQNTWYTADVAVELQQNLRSAMMHLTKELHQSGFKCNNPPDCTNTTVQVVILAGAGVNGTDIVRFKAPVDYNQDTYIKNSSGIVEAWGANLTWGCLDFNCQMPLSPEPQSLSYQIEYLLDADRQLLRRVLNDSLGPIRTDIFAHNIQSFQVTRNGNIINLTLSALKRTVLGRTITSSLSCQVLLRNKG